MSVQQRLAQPIQTTRQVTNEAVDSILEDLRSKNISADFMFRYPSNVSAVLPDERQA